MSNEVYISNSSDVGEDEEEFEAKYANAKEGKKIPEPALVNYFIENFEFIDLNKTKFALNKSIQEMISTKMIRRVGTEEAKDNKLEEITFTTTSLVDSIVLNDINYQKIPFHRKDSVTTSVFENVIDKEKSPFIRTLMLLKYGTLINTEKLSGYLNENNDGIAYKQKMLGDDSNIPYNEKESAIIFKNVITIPAGFGNIIDEYVATVTVDKPKKGGPKSKKEQQSTPVQETPVDEQSTPVDEQLMLKDEQSTLFQSIYNEMVNSKNVTNDEMDEINEILDMIKEESEELKIDSNNPLWVKLTLKLAAIENRKAGPAVVAYYKLIDEWNNLEGDVSLNRDRNAIANAAIAIGTLFGLPVSDRAQFETTIKEYTKRAQEIVEVYYTDADKTKKEIDAFVALKDEMIETYKSLEKKIKASEEKPPMVMSLPPEEKKKKKKKVIPTKVVNEGTLVITNEDPDVTAIEMVDEFTKHLNDYFNRMDSWTTVKNDMDNLYSRLALIQGTFSFTSTISGQEPINNGKKIDFLNKLHALALKQTTMKSAKMITFVPLTDNIGISSDFTTSGSFEYKPYFDAKTMSRIRKAVQIYNNEQANY